MKGKLILTLMCTAILSLICVGVSADVGDITDTIYTTDILTQVDGLDIESYAIDGETMIALEDLADYGFCVYYNNNVRTVFVTKNGTAQADFKPHVERGEVGGTAGYVYETDIKAFLNGVQINAYAIDGKMVAKVEEMGAARNRESYTDGEYKDHMYMMGYSYDDSKRLLSLDTNLSNYGSYAEAVDYYLSRTTPLAAYFATNIHTDGAWLVEKTMGGLPRGGVIYYQNMAYASGLSYDIGKVVGAYGLDFTDPVFNENGDKLYFKNYYDGEHCDYKQMELHSMHIFPLDEEAYNRAASYISPNNLTAQIDITDNVLAFAGNGSYIYPEIKGIKAPVYSVGGRDFIRVADMKDSGFLVSEDKTSKLLTIMNAPELKSKTENSEVLSSGYGRFIGEDECVPVINGRFMYNGDILLECGGELYLAVDAISEEYHKEAKPELTEATQLFACYKPCENRIDIGGLTGQAPMGIDRDRLVEDELVKTINADGCQVDVCCYEFDYSGNDVPEIRYNYNIFITEDNGIVSDGVQYIWRYMEEVGDEYEYNVGKWHVDYDANQNMLLIKLEQNNKTYTLDLDTYIVGKA